MPSAVSARGTKGENSRRDTLLIHRGDRLFRAPAQVRGIDSAATRSSDPVAIVGQVKGRDEVMMHIDQTRLGTGSSRLRDQFSHRCD